VTIFYQITAARFAKLIRPERGSRISSGLAYETTRYRPRL